MGESGGKGQPNLAEQINQMHGIEPKEEVKDTAIAGNAYSEGRAPIKEDSPRQDDGTFLKSETLLTSEELIRTFDYLTGLQDVPTTSELTWEENTFTLNISDDKENPRNITITTEDNESTPEGVTQLTVKHPESEDGDEFTIQIIDTKTADLGHHFHSEPTRYKIKLQLPEKLRTQQLLEGGPTYGYHEAKQRLEEAYAETDAIEQKVTDKTTTRETADREISIIMSNRKEDEETVSWFNNNKLLDKDGEVNHQAYLENRQKHDEDAIFGQLQDIFVGLSTVEQKIGSQKAYADKTMSPQKMEERSARIAPLTELVNLFKEVHREAIVTRNTVNREKYNEWLHRRTQLRDAFDKLPVDGGVSSEKTPKPTGEETPKPTNEETPELQPAVENKEAIEKLVTSAKEEIANAEEHISNADKLKEKIEALETQISDLEGTKEDPKLVQELKDQLETMTENIKLGIELQKFAEEGLILNEEGIPLSHDDLQSLPLKDLLKVLTIAIGESSELTDEQRTSVTTMIEVLTSYAKDLNDAEDNKFDEDKDAILTLFTADFNITEQEALEEKLTAIDLSEKEIVKKIEKLTEEISELKIEVLEEEKIAFTHLSSALTIIQEILKTEGGKDIDLTELFDQIKKLGDRLGFDFDLDTMKLTEATNPIEQQQAGEDLENALEVKKEEVNTQTGINTIKTALVKEQEKELSGFKKFLKGAGEFLTSAIGGGVARTGFKALFFGAAAAAGFVATGPVGLVVAGLAGAAGGALSSTVFSHYIHYRVFKKKKHAIYAEHANPKEGFGNVFKRRTNEALNKKYQVEARVLTIADIYNRMANGELKASELSEKDREKVLQILTSSRALEELTYHYGLNNIGLPADTFKNKDGKSVAIETALNEFSKSFETFLNQAVDAKQLTADQVTAAVKAGSDTATELYEESTSLRLSNIDIWKEKAKKGALVGLISGVLFEGIQNVRSGAGFFGTNEITVDVVPKELGEEFLKLQSEAGQEQLAALKDAYPALTDSQLAEVAKIAAADGNPAMTGNELEAVREYIGNTLNIDFANISVDFPGTMHEVPLSGMVSSEEANAWWEGIERVGRGHHFNGAQFDAAGAMGPGGDHSALQRALEYTSQMVPQENWLDPETGEIVSRLYGTMLTTDNAAMTAEQAHTFIDNVANSGGNTYLEGWLDSIGNPIAATTIPTGDLHVWANLADIGNGVNVGQEALATEWLTNNPDALATVTEAISEQSRSTVAKILGWGGAGIAIAGLTDAYLYNPPAGGTPGTTPIQQATGAAASTVAPQAAVQDEDETPIEPQSPADKSRAAIVAAQKKVNETLNKKDVEETVQETIEITAKDGSTKMVHIKKDGIYDSTPLQNQVTGTPIKIESVVKEIFGKKNPDAHMYRGTVSIINRVASALQITDAYTADNLYVNIQGSGKVNVAHQDETARRIHEKGMRETAATETERISKLFRKDANALFRKEYQILQNAGAAKYSFLPEFNLDKKFSKKFIEKSNAPDTAVANLLSLTEFLSDPEVSLEKKGEAISKYTRVSENQWKISSRALSGNSYRTHTPHAIYNWLTVSIASKAAGIEIEKNKTGEVTVTAAKKDLNINTNIPQILKTYGHLESGYQLKTDHPTTIALTKLNAMAKGKMPTARSEAPPAPHTAETDYTGLDAEEFNKKIDEMEAELAKARKAQEKAKEAPSTEIDRIAIATELLSDLSKQGSQLRETGLTGDVYKIVTHNITVNRTNEELLNDLSTLDVKILTIIAKAKAEANEIPVTRLPTDPEELVAFIAAGVDFSEIKKDEVVDADKAIEDALSEIFVFTDDEEKEKEIKEQITNGVMTRDLSETEAEEVTQHLFHSISFISRDSILSAIFPNHSKNTEDIGENMVKEYLRSNHTVNEEIEVEPTLTEVLDSIELEDGVDPAVRETIKQAILTRSPSREKLSYLAAKDILDLIYKKTTVETQQTIFKALFPGSTANSTIQQAYIRAYLLNKDF